MPLLRIHRFAVLVFLLVWSLRISWADEVNDLELLPPLGDTESEIIATPESVLPSADVADEVIDMRPAWYPPTWFSSPLWDFGAELGLNGSEGNAQALSILAAFEGKLETDANVMEWDLKYGRSTTDGVESQHYGLFNSRWDWKFSPRWFLYNKNLLEYDEFKAFDLRVAVSGGLGNHFYRTETTKLTGRLGAGTSREFGGPDDSWVPEANLGADLEHQLSPRQKIKLTSDYYPSWEDFRDYRLISNAYWEILLDEATNLSLKIGAVDRYDSTPNGALANDIDYFVTLLWKM